MSATERFKGRLALALGRTIRELEETLGADEWAFWLRYHALYDLPDGYIVTGQIGALISQSLGGKGRPVDFAPFYEAPPAARRFGPPPGIAEAIKFVKAHGRSPATKP